MSDYSELKRLADEAIVFAGLNGEISYAQELFIAAANPTAVLALIAENERYLKLVERMVDQYVPLTELEGVPGWSRVVELVEVVAERDRLKTEVEGLRAQHCRDSAELRSLCQARDDARKERDQLKAEVEALRKDAERFRHLMFNHVDWARNGKDDDLVVLEFGPYPSHKLRDSIDAAMTKGAKS